MKLVQDDFKGIAESWLEFIKEENKISFEDKGDENKFAINESLIKETENSLGFSLPDKIINLFINEIKNLLNHKKDEDQAIKIDYTLAMFLSKIKRKICPFLFQTNTLTINSSEIDLAKNYSDDNKNEELYNLLKTKLDPINIDIFSTSSSTVLATHNISEFFNNISPEEIDLLVESNETPISILETVIGIDKSESLNLSFKDRFIKVLNELKNKSKNKNEDLITSGLIIFNFENLQGATKNIQKFIENRINDIHFYNNKLSNETPIYSYLFGNVKTNFDEYNNPSNTYWYGHATEFPLSKGQALVLQKLEEGENLIAIQGPPGTGKTTLLLNIIAYSIVKRALNIIKGDDFNNLIFVTSTANEAVNNAIRDFEETYLNKLNFYSNFFLDLRNEKMVLNSNKIENFLNFMKENEFSEEKYKESIENINHLIEILNKYKQLFLKNKDIMENKNKYENFKIQLQKVEDEEVSFFENLMDQENISKEEFLKVFEKLKDKTFKKLLKTFSEYITEDRLLEFIEEVKRLNYEITREKSIIEKIKKIFIKKDLFKELYLQYSDIMDSLGQKIDQSNISEYANKLNKFSYEIRKFNDRQSLKLILCTNLYEKYENIKDRKIQLEKNKSQLDLEIKRLENEVKQIEEEINNAINDYNEKNDEKIKTIDLNAENCLFDLYRTKLYSLNRLILKNSIDLLKNYCLKEKEPLEKNLNLFKKYFSINSEGYKEILNNIKEFYRYLSLAFPVVISTLHSSTKLFKGFEKTLIKENINPIFISFIDEAGMANAYLPFPIISMSENVISVGDPLQLLPVIPLNKNIIENYHDKWSFIFQNLRNNLNDEEFEKIIVRKRNRYSPAKTSVYHRCAKCETGEYNDIGQAIFLNEHRRCQKPIADLFVKIANYHNISVATNELKDDDLRKLNNFTQNEKIKLVFYDVEGEFAGSDKTNKREAIAISLIIRKLIEAGYIEKEIGIITPFVDQERYIKKILHSNGFQNINVGTVHKFQGQEFPVIIFSSVIFSKSQLSKIGFLDDKPNLLNVAISRAKNLFIMVGNLDILEKSGNYLKTLVQFFKENNKHATIIYEGEILSEKEYKLQKQEIDNLGKKTQREVLDTKVAILEFQQLLEKTAKKDIKIIVPWIKNHTISYLQKSLEIVSKRGVKLKILYGYGDKKNDDETKEAIELLRRYNNSISLSKIGKGTHAKVLIVDNDIVYIGSLNWLSHKYYQLLDLDNNKNLKLRNEIVVKFHATQDEINNILDYTSSKTL